MYIKKHTELIIVKKVNIITLIGVRMKYINERTFLLTTKKVCVFFSWLSSNNYNLYIKFIQSW